MATTNETGRSERRASDLMDLARAAGHQTRGLPGADLDAVARLRFFVDHLGALRRDLSLAAASLAGRGTTSLLARLEDRYLTDDLDAGLTTAIDSSFGHAWGDSAVGYWGMEDEDRVIIALEDDEDAADVLAESTEVRRAVRRSLFERSTAARRSSGPSTHQRGGAPVKVGAPRRPPLWAPEAGALVHAGPTTETSETREASVRGADDPTVVGGANRTTAAMANGGLEWRHPYPRAMGRTGSRYVTPAARSIARLAGVGTGAGRVAGPRLDLLAASLGGRAATGTLGQLGGRHQAAVEEAPIGGASTSLSGPGGYRDRAVTLDLDGMPIGRPLPALSTALRVARAAFVPGAAGAGGGVGPATVERMLSAVTLSGHPSTPSRRQGPGASGFREPLDVEWIAPGDGDGSSAPARQPAPAETRRGPRASVSLFDIIPGSAAAARRPARGAHREVASPAPGSDLGLSRGLPRAEQFAVGAMLRHAAVGSAPGPETILGPGWDASSGATSFVGGGASTRPVVAGEAAGDVTTAVAANGGETTRSALLGFAAPAGAVLLPHAGLRNTTDRSSSRWEAERPAPGSRMGHRVSDLVRALSLSADEASIVLGALRSAGEDASPDVLARALARQAGAAPMALRSVAETVLLDMAASSGASTIHSDEVALGEASLRRDRGAHVRGDRLRGDAAGGGSAARIAERVASRRGRAVPPSGVVRAGASSSEVTTNAPVRVSVRLPNGAIIALPSASSRGGAAGDAATPGVGGRPIDVILPTPATMGQASLAAAPHLLQRLDARQLRGLMSATTTDVARAFALGLPETAVASLRGLTDSGDAGSTATYRSLLRQASELDMVAPSLETPGTGMGTLPNGAPSNLWSLDALRTLGRRTSPVGGPSSDGSRDGKAAMRRMGVASPALPGAGARTSARAGQQDRMVWSASAAAAGGLTLELLAAAPLSGARTNAAGELAGAPFMRTPDGRLIAAPPGARGIGARAAAQGTTARTAGDFITPAAGAARSSLGFVSQQLGALGLDVSRTGAETFSFPQPGASDYGLAGELDLVTAEAGSDASDSATGDDPGLSALERRTARMMRASGQDRASVAGAVGQPVANSARSLVRGAGIELGLVAPEAATPQTPSGARAGHRQADRVIGRTGRRASLFTPVAALPGAPLGGASAAATTGGIAPTTLGSAPAGTLAATSALGGTPGLGGRGRRVGGIASAFGLDVALDASFVQASEGPPRASDASTERDAQGARGARGTAGLRGDRTARAGGATAAGASAATWTQLSGLLRRLSNGGSATPLQRELAAMVHGLPASVAARVAMEGGSVGFSRDLLIRLENAIDTLAGTSAVDQLAAGIRGLAVAPVSRLSDLGAGDLVSLPTPVLGSDPFEATGETSRTPGGRRASAAAAASDRGTMLSQAPQAPVGSSALDDMDWSLVSPHAPAREGNRSSPDMGMLARATLSGGDVARAELPLIAPAAVAVATQAHLSAREDRTPEASAPANAGRTDTKKPAEAKVDLDKLAVEMANRISTMTRVQLERRGIWHSHKT